MKCPSCKIPVNDNIKKCSKCGFCFANLKDKITKLPRKSGWLIDNANIVEEKYTNLIFEYLICLNKKTGIQFYVVIVPDCEDLLPSEYVFYFLNHYNIGEEQHRGVVLLLSLKQKTIACEVGYSLEHILSDADAEDILSRDLVPMLQEKKYGEALYTGINLLGDILVNGHSKWKRLMERLNGIFNCSTL